eukprot:1145380-Pelagomonas_calceolata.AAC.4
MGKTAAAVSVSRTEWEEMQKHGLLPGTLLIPIDCSFVSLAGGDTWSLKVTMGFDLQPGLISLLLQEMKNILRAS